MAKRAKDFAASPDLRETMAKAAVMDDPTSGQEATSQPPQPAPSQQQTPPQPQQP